MPPKVHNYSYSKQKVELLPSFNGVSPLVYLNCHEMEIAIDMVLKGSSWSDGCF